MPYNNSRVTPLTLCNNRLSQFKLALDNVSLPGEHYMVIYGESLYVSVIPIDQYGAPKNARWEVYP